MDDLYTVSKGHTEPPQNFIDEDFKKYKEYLQGIMVECWNQPKSLLGFAVGLSVVMIVT